MIAINEGRSGLLAVEEVRVVASFSQLHQHVEHLLSVVSPVDGVDVACEDLLVRDFLHLTHAYI